MRASFLSLAVVLLLAVTYPVVSYGDDDLDALAAWYYVYGSASATNVAPSEIWCGKFFKTDPSQCPSHPGASKGIARERAEIRGLVISASETLDSPNENEFHLKVLLDHTWSSVAPTDLVLPINTTRAIGSAVTPHNIIHFGLGDAGRPSSNLALGVAWGGSKAAIVNVEVNACGPTRSDGLAVYRNCIPRPGWTDWIYPVNPQVAWPFDALNPPSLQSGRIVAGDHVRLVGTLWEDDIHLHSGCSDLALWKDNNCGGTGGEIGESAQQYWDGGGTAKRGWMELHPVDFMAKIEHPVITETIEVLVVCCAYKVEFKRDIRPPVPRPSSSATIAFEEVVDDSFTVWKSVKTPHRVTVLPDGIRVTVKVQQGGFLGIGGHGAKFKATYRVFWRE